MMKRIMILWIVLCCICLPIQALGEGAVLLVEIPESAQMIEDVKFDDGDFIQTYQLENGGTVQLLRYAQFDMTLDDLVEGEWVGYSQKQEMSLDQVSNYPAQGVELVMDGENGSLRVYVVMVEAEGQSLIFQAIFPPEIEEEVAQQQMDDWLESLTVNSAENAAVVG